jgi:hypothetical protein
MVHHGTDELLIQQNTIPEGETASPVQERSKRSLSLCRFLPHLVDMLRPVEPFIKGNSKITGDVISDRLALLAHSVCMRPSVQ